MTITLTADTAENMIALGSLIGSELENGDAYYHPKAVYDINGKLIGIISVESEEEL